MKDYTNQATIKAEKDGIINYNVKGSAMTYTVSYPTEGSYKHIVNLATGKEVITECTRIFKKYDNRGVGDMSNITLINKIARDLMLEGYDFNTTVLKLQTINYGKTMESNQPVDLEEIKEILF